MSSPSKSELACSGKNNTTFSRLSRTRKCRLRTRRIYVTMETVASFIDFLDHRPTTEKLCGISEGILSFIQDDQDFRENFEYGCIMDLCDVNADFVPDLDSVLKCDESLSQSDCELELNYCSEDPRDVTKLSSPGEEVCEKLHSEEKTRDVREVDIVSVPEIESHSLHNNLDNSTLHMRIHEADPETNSHNEPSYNVSVSPNDIDIIDENLSQISMGSGEGEGEEERETFGPFEFLTTDDMEIEGLMEESIFHERLSTSTPVTVGYQGESHLVVPDILDYDDNSISGNSSFSDNLDWERSLGSCQGDHVVPDVFYEE